MFWAAKAQNNLKTSYLELTKICGQKGIIKNMPEQYSYQNPELSIAQRIEDLLGRMTLEEKVAQLHGLAGLDGASTEPVTPNGNFSLAKARRDCKNGIAWIGSHHLQRDTRATVEYINAVQRFLRDETRLGIPALVIGEALHGYMAHDATSFPQAIALASSWDPALAERVFAAAALEMRLRGATWALTPVLDLARDPRWGRTEETYGEDPYLVAQIGLAAVRGLQGEQPGGNGQRVLATAKHFAVHGQPEGGTNAAPANYAERIIREQFLIPFQAAVGQGGVAAVMASYNEVNGVPSHINPWLLQQVLQDEWGFQGLVISDAWGVNDLVNLHHVAASLPEAARRAFLAGVDIELGHCFASLVDEVKAGRVPEVRLDEAVRRVLAAKFRLGIFENPFVDLERAVEVTGCAGHRQLALAAALKAMILLKNEGDLLPLDMSKLRRLAVIGPNAGYLRLGGYSARPLHGVTVLEGIRQKVGDQVEVVYAQGCRLTLNNVGPLMWHDDLVELPDPHEEAALIAEAAELARTADVALVVVGDNEQTCREGWSASHLGDRDSLDLVGFQDDLIRAVVETGTPVILLLINGRPPTINYAVEHVPAILEGWYLGQETGTAVAQVLFGEANPGGKLPVTFPRSVGQIPADYYQKPSARRGYLFTSQAPLFPFGHGLSYTTFRYSNLTVSPRRIRLDENATVSVEVTNTGRRLGDEVVQCYIHDRVASLTRPVMELKGFRRITLQPGDGQTVAFTLAPKDLSFLDISMQRIVEPGVFDIMVGSSSVDWQAVQLEVLAE